MPTESDFVGEGRRVLVDGLVELFQELCKSNTASTIWVSLASSAVLRTHERSSCLSRPFGYAQVTLERSTRWDGFATCRAG